MLEYKFKPRKLEEMDEYKNKYDTNGKPMARDSPAAGSAEISDWDWSCQGENN